MSSEFPTFVPKSLVEQLAATQATDSRTFLNWQSVCLALGLVSDELEKPPRRIGDFHSLLAFVERFLLSIEAADVGRFRIEKRTRNMPTQVLHGCSYIGYLIRGTYEDKSAIVILVGWRTKSVVAEEGFLSVVKLQYGSREYKKWERICQANEQLQLPLLSFESDPVPTDNDIPVGEPPARPKSVKKPEKKMRPRNSAGASPEALNEFHHAVASYEIRLNSTHS